MLNVNTLEVYKRVELIYHTNNTKSGKNSINSKSIANFFDKMFVEYITLK